MRDHRAGLDSATTGQRVKTDRPDAAKLVRLFRAGELTAIHVPDEREEGVRDLVRCRDDVRRDVLRWRHRVLKLLAYLGLVPSEYSSGDTQHRGALNKAGNRHARRVLVEAAWHYRHRPTVGRALAHRSEGAYFGDREHRDRSIVNASIGRS